VTRWWALVKFGRKHVKTTAPQHPYFSAVQGLAVQLGIRAGVAFGFFAWLFVEVVNSLLESGWFLPALNHRHFDLPVWGYALAGFLFGLLRGIVNAPGDLRVTIVRPTSNPSGRIKEARDALLELGMEPLEVSERHYKMGTPDDDFTAGPIVFKRVPSHVMLVSEDDSITISGRCGTLKWLGDRDKAPS